MKRLLKAVLDSIDDPRVPQVFACGILAGVALGILFDIEIEDILL